MTARDFERGLTPERLRSLLDYTPDTGAFTWRARPISEVKNCKTWKTLSARYAGKIAGGPTPYGYIQIGVDGHRYLAHRLAWLHFYGLWPEDQLDHINGRRSDNRIGNLRDVSALVNGQNRREVGATNKSGLLGVSMHRDAGKWQSHIRANGKSIYLGLYADKHEAHKAYVLAKRALHKGCTL